MIFVYQTACCFVGVYWLLLLVSNFFQSYTPCFTKARKHGKDRSVNSTCAVGRFIRKHGNEMFDEFNKSVGRFHPSRRFLQFERFCV
jgi:hypothetical protein